MGIETLRKSDSVRWGYKVLTHKSHKHTNGWALLVVFLCHFVSGLDPAPIGEANPEALGPDHFECLVSKNILHLDR